MADKKVPLLNSKIIKLQISEDPIIYNDDETITIMLHYNSFNIYRDCLGDAKKTSTDNGHNYIQTNPKIFMNCKEYKSVPVFYSSFQATKFDSLPGDSKPRDYMHPIFDEYAIGSLKELKNIAQTFHTINGSYREHSIIFHVIPYIDLKCSGKSFISFDCKKIEIIHPTILIREYLNTT